jgi:hypothetical protein
MISMWFSRFRKLLVVPFVVLPVAAQTLYIPGGTTSGIGNNIANGNVGIGVAIPIGKLHVSGDVRFGVGYGALSEAASNAATILGNNVIAGAGANSVKRYFDDPGYGAYLKINNLGLTFHNVSSQANATEVSYDTGELFRITNGGNVGVGTSSPQVKLHVDASSYNTEGIRSSYGNNSHAAGIGVEAFGTYWGAGIFQDGNMLGNFENGGLAVGPSFVQQNVPANGLIVQGNVGVGTFSPITSLQVVGTITAGSASGSTNGVDYIYGYYGAGKLFALGSQYSSGASFLGYGVKAQPGATGYLSSTSVAIGRSAFEANNGYIAFWTGATQTSTDGGSVGITEQMRINSSGNVGIGTTNPTQRLSVNGTIQAKEVIVQTGWSDYVFDEGYKLKALSEVEAYVKAEKHLPGIPSAQEVAEHGVSMGEMQSKLLAKIEELTLHQIALEKENRALQERVHTLEQRPE